MFQARDHLGRVVLLDCAGIGKPALKRHLPSCRSLLSALSPSFPSREMQPAWCSSCDLPGESGPSPVSSLQWEVFTWSCSTSEGKERTDGQTLSPRHKTEGSSNPTPYDFCPAPHLAIEHPLGIQPMRGPRHQGRGLLPSWTQSWPPPIWDLGPRFRTRRNDDTFLLQVRSLLLPEPKGAGSLPSFQNSWF